MYNKELVRTKGATNQDFVPKIVLALHSAGAIARMEEKNYEEENFSNSYGTYIRRSNAYSLWFISR